jgi:hypothetical protein
VAELTGRVERSMKRGCTRFFPGGFQWLPPFAVALALLAGTGVLHAQPEDVVTEYRIKAAYLFKFGGYVDWPAESFADAGSPLVIGVLGADQVAADLSGMVPGRVVNGRKVEVRAVHSGESPAGVHVLFVGRAENHNLGTILEGVAGLPVLVVTETDDARSGGAINFVLVQNRVRFDIAPASAESRKLRISARLLGVARNVVNGSS